MLGELVVFERHHLLDPWQADETNLGDDWHDIHLPRARLFFCEKPYPWKSPQDDLAAAEKFANDCGYHRRDQELADANKAILGNT